VTSIGIIAFHIEHLDISLNYFLDSYKKIQNNYLFEPDEFTKVTDIYHQLYHYDISLLDEKIKYLFISRKHSMCYVVFIRGKFDLDNIEYITNTIQLMTIQEKENLLHKSFDELWIDLWSYDETRIIYNQEYEESKEKFTKLREGYTISKNDILLETSLGKIIFYTNQHPEQVYIETEWGFPKGRRNMNEKNLDCGKREFQEETGLFENDYEIFNISPLEETYYGSNQICYKHIYYFAQTKELKNVEINSNNVHQFNEIGDIQWLSISQGIQKIRNYHREKKNVLYNFHMFLKEAILHFLNQFPIYHENHYRNYIK
jgi:8-oxo-dGTP pyrophosphatase MutT (NUDIX family)